MKKWKRYLPLGVLTLVLAATAMLTFTVQAEETEHGVIPDRVYFGDIDGGGMTQEEAVEAIEAYVEQLSQTKVILKAGENTLESTAGALGLSWLNPDIVKEAAGLGKSGNLIARYMVMKDLEHEDKVYTIAFAVDSAKIAELLEENLETLNTEAVDAQLSRENEEFVITPGSQGVTVNVASSAEKIEEYFTAGWDQQEAQVELVAEVVNPKGTEEELRKVQDVLGSYHTNFSSSSAGRVKNLQVGSSKINGKVLYPGEQFSVNEVCGPFDAAGGYELAGAYENGATVQAYGGGICQVSTTLYNAVIRAELQITERFAHSMTVDYVQPSEDAAIAGSYKDLKFVNNTEAPLYIEGYTSGRDLYFTIYGQETRPANREVSFVSETTNSAETDVEFKAIDAPVGTINKVQSAHVGKSARLWKIVTVNGVEESREIFNTSSYRSSPAIYEVGISSANAEAAAGISAALASQDEASIRAAASYWSDEAIAEREAAAAPPPTTPEQPVTPPTGGETTPPAGGETTPPTDGTPAP